MRAVPDLWANFVRKIDGQGLVLAGHGHVGQLVEDPPRDAQLDEGILELVAILQEAPVENEGVGGDLQKALGGETRRGEESLALGKQPSRPVNGTAEATRGAMS